MQSDACMCSISADARKLARKWQYLSDKVGGVAQFSSTGCLIGSLATWQHSPRFSSNSLPRGRNAFHFDVHVCICRTDNNQRSSHRLCMLLQDSRGFSVVLTWRGSGTQSCGTPTDYLHQSTVDNLTHTLRSTSGQVGNIEGLPVSDSVEEALTNTTIDPHYEDHADKKEESLHTRTW